MFSQLSLFDDLSAVSKLFSRSGERRKSTRDVENSAEVISFQGQEVEVLRRPYQRSLNVLVKPSGALKVTAGKRVRVKAIESFLLGHDEWIRGHQKKFAQLRRRYPEKKYAAGEKFLLRGRVYSLLLESGAKEAAEVFERGRELVLCEWPGLRSSRRERVRDYYEWVGRRELLERCQFWSQRMGLVPAKLSFRSQKSRWGSCSSRGQISLNWRLVTFPESLWDYVVIHELAHLRHQNHGRRFWQLVESFCPRFQVQRKYLAQHHYEVDFLAKKTELYER